MKAQYHQSSHDTRMSTNPYTATRQRTRNAALMVGSNMNSMRTAASKPLSRGARVGDDGGITGRASSAGVKRRWPDDSILRRRTRCPRVALIGEVAEPTSGEKNGSLGGTTARDWAARSAIVAREGDMDFIGENSQRERAEPQISRPARVSQNC